jgi:hypothetical protein
MGRTSPGAGDDDARRLLPQRGGERGDRSGEYVLLAKDLRCLAGFPIHSGVRFVA